MASPFTSVNENAREEILSSDLNRMQKLLSQALQNELLYDATDANGNAINCFTKIPTIAGVVASFTVSLGQGEALVFDTTGVSADDSNFKVCQWASQVVGPFTAPDPVNPRIDLITITPASVASDIESRNVLTDPVARAVVPQNVPKTNSPTATIAVVTGTAAATPVPPAVPSGSFAMYEVYVPALAADSTAFGFGRRLQQRVSYPARGAFGDEPPCGIIRGCRVLVVSTFAAISQASGTGTQNAVLIDGEVVPFQATSSSGITDTLANPFAGAAPAGNDVPFFLYVVGGRNSPQGRDVDPVALVPSLTPPDIRTGRPSSPIQPPRGSPTQSAVYVGLGFVRKGTTNYQLVQHVEDECYWVGTTPSDPGFENAITAGVGDNSITLASCPPSSSNKVRIKLQNITGGGQLTIRTPAQPTSVAMWERSYGGAVAFDGTVDIPIPGNSGGPQFNAFNTASASDLVPVMYNMRGIRRLG